ncbi:hypothetical protein [uncultured Sphingomonas sp.]|uniref:hypothetical protein n=1 Tax=uncultured Sphingomonas sp. TaxID=158754 RepID=UPI00260146DD|nr:hypothetical protein [uncultured Sphingomonas sp.]
MQWFHFHDPRLDEAVAWMKRLGTRRIRTGLSWADSFREGALDWFDRKMEALTDFDVTVTFCFTPAHLGIEPHHTSPARDPQAFAHFCAWMIDRYAGTATIAPSAAPVALAGSQPERNPLLFNRDERLVAERKSAWCSPQIAMPSMSRWSASAIVPARSSRGSRITAPAPTTWWG